MRLARRPGKPARFLLTPLVDVIFLLLTFFMLSSSLAPYSLLTLGDFRSEREGEQQAPPPQTAPAAPGLVLTVDRGIVRANGEAVALLDLPAALAALRAAGVEAAVVTTREGATVQDIVSVLEALKRAAFRHVTVRSRRV